MIAWPCWQTLVLCGSQVLVLNPRTANIAAESRLQSFLCWGRRDRTSEGPPKVQCWPKLVPLYPPNLPIEGGHYSLYPRCYWQSWLRKFPPLWIIIRDPSTLLAEVAFLWISDNADDDIGRRCRRVQLWQLLRGSCHTCFLQQPACVKHHTYM